MRKLTGIHRYIVSLVGFSASAYHLYTGTFGVFTPRLQRSIHFIFLLPLAFLLYPAGKKSPQDRPSVIDYCLSFLVFLPNIYIVIMNPILEKRWEFVSEVLPIQIILGTIFIVIVFEMIRRVVTPALAAVVGILLFYLFVGENIPAESILSFRGFSFAQNIELLYLIKDEGIYGMMAGISATYIAIFIIFGAFLTKTGITKFFSDFARAFAGGARGGPAKIAVISSALFGTVSGVSVANVFATGSFTIPLMKKAGYNREFAGAVEAVSSTGGQYLPPVMGAAAFLIAETLSIPYIMVVGAAAISGILFYISIFINVDIVSIKNHLIGEKKENLPKKKDIFRKIYLIFPLLLLFYLLIKGYSPIYAGVYCIYFAILIAIINPKTRNKFLGKGFIDSMIDAGKNTVMLAVLATGAGIIIAIITHTGLGLKFAKLIIGISGGELIFAMFIIALGAILLGTGAPATAAYILSVILGGRALIEMGVLPIGAHLFCYYFAIIATITPPVAMTAYAAASIAQGDQMRTGIEAFKLGISGFIIPFMFILYPGLLLEGTASEGVFSIITALFVLYLVCSTTRGYFYDQYLNNIGRLSLIPMILLVLSYNNIHKIIGVILFIIFLIGRKTLFSMTAKSTKKIDNQ